MIGIKRLFMSIFRATCDRSCDQEILWEYLTEKGAENLIIIDSLSHLELIAAFPYSTPPELPQLSHWVPYEMGEVDWDQQWEQHLAEYVDGTLRLLAADQEILLTAGPGFGDTSHPTTQLVMQLMAPFVKDKCVVDVGCGSGILSFVAAACGARCVHGMDMDPDAVCHAHRNLELNTWATQLSFHASDAPLPEEDFVVLLNMISSEQEAAWAMYPALERYARVLISSGMRSEEKKAWLERWKGKGWAVREISEDQGWLAVVSSC